MSNLLKMIFVSSIICSSNLYSMCMGCKRDQSLELKTCAACKTVAYCSQECQKADWKEHKKACGAIKKSQQHKNDRDQAHLKPKALLAKQRLAKLIEAKKSLLGQRQFEEAIKLLANSKDKEARAMLLELLNSKNDPAIRANAAYYLARMGIMKIEETGDDSIFHDVIEYLKKAVDLGHKPAEALLVLFLNAPEEHEDINDSYIKKDLEKYADDDFAGLKIQARLAFDYYYKSNPKLAQEIFDKLQQEDHFFPKLLGAIGKLKILAHASTKDLAAMTSAMSLAQGLYKICPAKNRIEEYIIYDFATILFEHGDQEQHLFSIGIFQELIQRDYRPALYFVDEHDKIAKKEEAARQEQLKADQDWLASWADSMISRLESDFKLLAAEPALLSQSAKAVESEMKTSAPVAPLVTLIREDPTIMALKTQFTDLSAEATKDIKKLVKKHGVLPFHVTDIIGIAQDIIASQGQCNSKLACKIRGSKTFWRSWIGRDYRMDWSYIRDTDGHQKIEIRHVGPKKSFTYRF